VLHAQLRVVFACRELVAVAVAGQCLVRDLAETGVVDVIENGAAIVHEIANPCRGAGYYGKFSRTSLRTARPLYIGLARLALMSESDSKSCKNFMPLPSNARWITCIRASFPKDESSRSRAFPKTMFFSSREANRAPM